MYVVILDFVNMNSIRHLFGYPRIYGYKEVDGVSYPCFCNSKLNYYGNNTGVTPILSSDSTFVTDYLDISQEQIINAVKKAVNDGRKSVLIPSDLVKRLSLVDSLCLIPGLVLLRSPHVDNNPTSYYICLFE